VLLPLLRNDPLNSRENRSGKSFPYFGKLERFWIFLIIGSRRIPGS
jgi:hypothetical protein